MNNNANRAVRSAAILAGGNSRRMGFDKALLTARDGRRNLDLLAESLAARFADVFIVRRRGLYEQSPLPSGVRVVYDDMEEAGPLTGVVSAMAHGAGQYVFVCACDAWPVPATYLHLIISRTDTYAADAAKAANAADATNAANVVYGADAANAICAANAAETADAANAANSAYIATSTDAACAAVDAVLPRVGGYIQPFWAVYGVHLLPQARAAASSGRQSPFRFIENRNIRIIEEDEIAAAGISLSMFSNRND